MMERNDEINYEIRDECIVRSQFEWLYWWICQIETSSSVLWKESELNREERALLKTVVGVIGQSAKRPIQLEDNFFDVGGNSLNAVSVVTKLQDQGFFIGNYFENRWYD